MFSEYASRFLAQSQSRLSSFGQQQQQHFDPDGGAPSSRAPQPDWFSSRPSRLQARSFLSRGPYSAPASNNTTATTPAPHSGNPYQPAGSRFGFASRISAAQDAPLFRSVASDFHHEEDDDHGDGDDDYDDDREAKDLFALQRSRRVAAASKLAESSETDNDASRGSLERSAEAVSAGRASPPGPGPGSARSATGALRSNWPARRPFEKARTGERDALLEGDEDEEEEDGSLLSHNRGGRGGGGGGGGGAKGKMVDVGLESQLGEDEMPGSLLLAGSLGDTSPPAFQQFKFQRPGTGRREEPAAAAQESGSAEHGGDLDFDPEAEQAGAGHELGQQQQQLLPRPIPLIDGEWFKHDGFFACAFIILQFALFSTFVLVWLQTTTPTGPIGDTIYTALRASFHMLAVDTVVSIVVALFWLAALRSFVRPLVTAIVVATPTVLLTFSLYSFVWSFKGDTHGRSLQDTVMRWTAVVPAIGSVLWVYVVFRARRSIRRAVEILEFSSRILSANPALLMLGLLCLALIVVWTWVWLVMFNRIFLEGHFSRNLARWVMSVSSWWLGAWFVFMHLWTVSVISSVQQAATAATVSQWYFHRNAGPAPPSSQIVSAAVAHALSKIFGTICESTLLSLLVRLPLIVLPGRVCAVITRVAALWLPTPVAALTNPLAITFAAIHSQSLAYSAKGISQIDFLSAQFPTTALTPRAFATPARSSAAAANALLPYRLAKTILVATRYLMATALGFAGWVFMAKNLYVAMPDGMGWRGSAYAYVVGIVASLIGLYIMGTMEGVLGGIVDAVVVCYGSERRMLRGAGGSAGAYCMEAAYLFGDRRRPGDEAEDGL